MSDRPPGWPPEPTDVRPGRWGLEIKLADGRLLADVADYRTASTFIHTWNKGEKLARAGEPIPEAMAAKLAYLTTFAYGDPLYD